MRNIEISRDPEGDVRGTAPPVCCEETGGRVRGRERRRRKLRVVKWSAEGDGKIVGGGGPIPPFLFQVGEKERECS